MRAKSWLNFFEKEHNALREAVRSRQTLALFAILAVGLIVRLLFIGATGFSNDVSSFESWSLTLADHPLAEFYPKAGFADYPPGYFLVLSCVGHLYRWLTHADPQWDMLKIFVKLPSILTDLLCGALLYVIVRRLTNSVAWGLAGAALFTLNPAMIFISAYWGQVDSVAACLVLGAVLGLFVAEDRRGIAAVGCIVAAWLLLSYSILIKPPAAILVLLFLAYAFVTRDAEQRRVRLTGTLGGLLVSALMAYGVTLLFHPDFNPLHQAAWLYGRYWYASGVYPYNSVNALNIYAVRWPFWQPDTVSLLHIGHWDLQQNTLGIITVLTATAFILERYVHQPDRRSLLEAALLMTLAFFILATRMHERYIFNAVTLCIALCGVHRRYLYATAALSVTLFVNLWYSLFYLHILNDKVQGYNPTDLVPWVTHPLSALNVAVFFGLAYLYIDARAADVFEAWAARMLQAARASVRGYFSPLEGITHITALDKLLALGFVIASLLVTGINFWLPTEKVFDEIYYARAAEEYLHHQEIFEFTHPPLTKLLIALSTWLFHTAGEPLSHLDIFAFTTGVLHDDSFGWRFLNVVVGALMVGVLYLFAKRLLGSTLFASIAAGMLVLDGFHFTQSRIATPEITVAFLSLTTLYLFYRFWLASRVRTAPRVTGALNLREGLFLAGATPPAALLAFIPSQAPFPAYDRLSGWFTPAWWTAFLYFEVGAYLLIRFLAPRLWGMPSMTSYADGAVVTEGMLRTSDGGVIDLTSGATTPGDITQKTSEGLAYRQGDLRIEYSAKGAMRYAVPEGEAVFTPDDGGTMRAGEEIARGRDGLFWLWMLSLSGGLLAASKWNGLFDFFVVWVMTALVVAQPLFSRRRPALWGNPYGFSLDIVVGMMLFVGATIYVLTYIPYFTLHHSFADFIGLQKQMFGYHYDLHATHPYSSQWWQWPILQVPISYYYSDFRHGAAAASAAACCVAEILALPNPVVWWSGLFSVPLLGWWAYRERNKGYALLVVAYFLQWLPWILSPRIAFEYHFFPNLAIIILANAAVLQRVWMQHGKRVFGSFAPAGVFTALFLAALPSVPMLWLVPGGRFWADAAAITAFCVVFFIMWTKPRFAVGAYVAAVIAAFIFWYPITAAQPLTWDAWNARMLTPLEGNNWINPHPGK